MKASSQIWCHKLFFREWTSYKWRGIRLTIIQISLTFEKEKIRRRNSNIGLITPACWTIGISSYNFHFIICFDWDNLNVIVNIQCYYCCYFRCESYRSKIKQNIDGCWHFSANIVWNSLNTLENNLNLMTQPASNWERDLNKQKECILSGQIVWKQEFHLNSLDTETLHGKFAKYRTTNGYTEAFHVRSNAFRTNRVGSSHQF